mgnify:CR=1 FL=1
MNSCGLVVDVDVFHQTYGGGEGVSDRPTDRMNEWNRWRSSNVVFFLLIFFNIYPSKKIIAISSFSHSFIPLVLLFSLSASYTHTHTDTHYWYCYSSISLSLSFFISNVSFFCPDLCVCVCVVTRMYTQQRHSHIFIICCYFFFDDHLSFTFSNTATILCYCCNWCCIYSFRFVSYTHMFQYPIHHYFYV